MKKTVNKTKIDKKNINNQTNEIMFRIFSDKLSDIEKKQNKFKLNIINDFLTIELVSISLITVKLLLKNEIKSDVIKNYLISSLDFYDNNLETIEKTSSLLIEMSETEDKEFSEFLNNENQIVQKYVSRLNNVFSIKYKNNSWELFNMIYNMEEKYFKIPKKITNAKKSLRILLKNILIEELNGIDNIDFSSELNPLYDKKTNSLDESQFKKILPNFKHKIGYIQEKFNW